jgi:DNA packaging protein, QLRG family
MDRRSQGEIAMDEKNLLEELKTKLLINFEDEELDKKIEDSLKSAEAHIDALVGTNVDYIDDRFARSLLLDCARYYYNNVSEFFEDNFHKEILRLQLLQASGAYDEDTKTYH